MVRSLQEVLRELDFNLPVTGLFDSATYAAVRSFQASHLDKHGIPLKVDGVVERYHLVGFEQSAHPG